MSAPSNHPPVAITQVPRTSWNKGRPVWGVGFIASAVAFSLALRGISFGYTFVPFGGIGAFLFGIPLCALLFKCLFIVLSKGSRPTVHQAILASVIALGFPALALARDLSLVMDDSGSYGLFALVLAILLPLNVAWALLAMHLWKGPPAAVQPIP